MVVLTKNVKEVKGENTIPLEINDISGASIYLLSLEGSSVKYDTKKVIITNK